MYEYCIMCNLCIDTCVAYSVPGKISLILAIKHDVMVSDLRCRTYLFFVRPTPQLLDNYNVIKYNKIFIYIYKHVKLTLLPSY